MPYTLYYWPTIPGRGEFVRLALEDGAIDYIDNAQLDDPDAMVTMMEQLGDKALMHRPFAPPFLRAGRLLIGQTANILLFLGEAHHLAPRSINGKLWTHQLQLTIADLVTEVHDTHHPLASSWYYEQQRAAARKRAANLCEERLPKFLGYFEDVLKQNGSGYLVGKSRTYADLSLFQLIAGLRYAFPKNLKRLERRYTHLPALYTRIIERPRIHDYVHSDRHLPFSEDGIFRHYPELDQ